MRKVWLREAPEIGRATRGARRKAVGIGRSPCGVLSPTEMSSLDREVTPRGEASDIHRPIARGRRLAPEENQENPGWSLREARGAWFDLAHHPEEDRGEGSRRSPK